MKKCTTYSRALKLTYLTIHIPEEFRKDSTVKLLEQLLNDGLVLLRKNDNKKGPDQNNHARAPVNPCKIRRSRSKCPSAQIWEIHL